MRFIMLAAASIMMLVSAAPIAHASDNKAMDADILAVAEEWAKIKYLSKDERREREDGGARSQGRRVGNKYPAGRDADLGWDRDQRARFPHLGAHRAQPRQQRPRSLLKPTKGPAALDGGAPTSLGVLYYRVPGFPLGWGDTDKARQFLEEAVKNAPSGRDAHYFYADFLFEQGDYKKAEQVLKTALALPHHPERPVWDTYFPKVMEGLLTKVQSKIRS